MSEPSAGDPGALAARLAALPDEQLLAVLVVAAAGRDKLTPLYEAATRLLSETGQSGSEPGVIPGTPDAAGYGSSPDLISSSQVGGGVGTVTGQGAGAAGPAGGYTRSGVPTFGSVRDKVERRIGTAFGARALDRQSPAGRGTDEQWEAREQAARERLAQIRTSLHEGEEA
ncbi:hypothetical protein [Nocardia jinanensis]|uniref:Uncharacterized protein n=1 Tax=Nocardia jinanensis TaxID=382504 RepID=A0A917RYR5_9NOCA|nr:hypothetical protein [Nocardia jinanensis]GGL43632.1 hypothetical protein GCM10011588_68010 [Nocardia jinanensis]